MDPTQIRQWTYPTRIVFGAGAVRHLPKLAAEAGMRKPLFVTDAGLAEAPITRAALRLLAEAGASPPVYANVKGNPTASNVEQGIEAFRRGGHDGVIAFGGGSGLDAGKAIAFMVAQERPLWDFEDVGDNWMRARTHGVAPVIAIPTTAGTGSEVGRASVISRDDTHDKKIIFHPAMMPKAAICDPELTLSLPPRLTAATGFDAFVHCFEAFCAPGYHPIADGIALQGMRLCVRHLPRAVEQGDDLVARAHMMAAAAMGAAAFQKGLGGVHALSHAIGARYDTHHGLTNAVVMPYVMQANRPAIEALAGELAPVLGAEEASFEAVFERVSTLRKAVGIPHALAELGAEETAADAVGARAVLDPTHAGNPVPLAAGDYAAIYRRALSGTL